MTKNNKKTICTCLNCFESTKQMIREMRKYNYFWSFVATVANSDVLKTVVVLVEEFVVCFGLIVVATCIVGGIRGGVVFERMLLVAGYVSFKRTLFPFYFRVINCSRLGWWILTVFTEVFSLKVDGFAIRLFLILDFEGISTG